MLWPLAFLHFLGLRSTFAKLVNTTIDDAFPGGTDFSISYSPPGAWAALSGTGRGRVAPDATRAQDGTWHDTTDDTTANHDGTTPTFMEINFQGIGIDVRCIIANNKADNASIPPFTGTKSNYSFFIDTVPQNKDYTHEAGTTGDAFLYNTSVFSTNALTNGPHTLKVLLNGGPDVDGSVLMLFDYALVTSDDGSGDAGPGSTVPVSTSATTTTQTAPTNTSSPSSTSHKTNIGAIVGGLGGLIALVILLLLCLRRKRSHRLRIPERILPFPYSTPPFRRRSSPQRNTNQGTTSLPSSLHALRPNPPNPPPSGPSTLTSSAPSGTSATSSEDPMRDYVQRPRAEVELLRRQQWEMASMTDVEPPPPYEDV